jgi:8-oxo-dGTP pyrophosphatase MutT (NUDIX family)
MTEPSLPRITVAALVERDGRFLLVEEEVRGARRLNQPAGHLEAGETVLEALRREALEETGYEVEPEALVGVYQWHAERTGKRYVRFAFAARLVAHHPEHPLDDGIIGPRWLTVDELDDPPAPLRSPLVKRNVEDYLAGKRHPLDLFHHLPPL